MLDGILTFDDYDFNNKTVLMRVDLNAPLDPKTGEILDDRRFRSHVPTIQELMDRNVKLVLIAHQGRPGEPDFTTLEKHTAKLQTLLKRPVKYVDALFSSDVAAKVHAMKPKDIILLENVRLYSEEVLQRPPDVQATTIFCKKLAPMFDVFVNDAFGTAHRSQPSIVGFPQLLPSVAGRLLEREYRTITDLLRNPKKPLTFIIGGAKSDDSLAVVKKALENGADNILMGGIVANIFLAAKGYRLGEPNIEFIRGKKAIDQIDLAKPILDAYEDKIHLPVDLAIDEYGKREEISVSNLPTNYKICDVGHKTVEEYVKIISKSKTIFANGALGIFEDKKFAYGTEEIIKAVASAKGFSVIGGGHTVAAAEGLKISEKITHVSSGGKACIDLLAGYKLPAIETLKQSKMGKPADTE
ncbi:Phosphoglycerate kinase [uncultured archaeon]|nr:Phosphoglycerate kinase [uncultured archaeon]